MAEHALVEYIADYKAWIKLVTGIDVAYRVTVAEFMLAIANRKLDPAQDKVAFDSVTKMMKLNCDAVGPGKNHPFLYDIVPFLEAFQR